MSESAPENSPNGPQIQSELRQLAELLRQAGHLAPQAQSSLAELLDELGSELESHGSISAKTEGLTRAVGDVARSLHEQHHASLLESAQDRLKDAAARAEAEAPVATGVVYRFIEALSSLGI